MKKSSLHYFFSIFILVGLTGFFYSGMPTHGSYPPVFSKTFPLSTPISFLASMFGMRRLAADIVWIQTLQYYGESECHHCAELRGLDEHDHTKCEALYPQLHKYWQQIIRFDPMFSNAYLTGPITLGWNLKRYDQAMELLDEGIVAVEDAMKKITSLDISQTDEPHPLIIGKTAYFEELKWKLYTLKAIIVFMHKQDYSKVIPLLEKIAFRQNTPEDIKVILAQVYEANKDYIKAMKLWLILYDTATKHGRKESARKHIQDLNAFISSGKSPL